jgi:RNA polymerase sigma factor (sigma-70 family)
VASLSCNRCAPARLYALKSVSRPALHVLRTSDDSEIVRRCVAGDRVAQRALFEREKRRVHATLFRILGSNQHVDDLMQDVFVAVFRSLHAFRGEASLATWIDRCAVRAAFGHIRRRRPLHHLELVAETIAADDPSAERRALDREAVRRLYATLERLEPKQRLAFTLCVIDDRSIPEAADLMNATVVATKARLWRARRHVQKCAKADPVLAGYLVDARRPVPAAEEEAS